MTRVSEKRSAVQGPAKCEAEYYCCDIPPMSLSLPLRLNHGGYYTVKSAPVF